MSYEQLIENGKATQFQSGEQAARNGAKGGIQSGISRRRKKTVKQAIDLALSLPVSDTKIKAKLKKMGLADEEQDNQMAVVAGLMGRAMKGDPKASALLFDLLDDENASATAQAESHNSLVEAIRSRHHED